MGLLAAAVLAAPHGPTPATLHAQTPLLETEDVRLDLGGYLRSLSGVHDTGYELPLADRRSGFHSQVLRLRWRLAAGDRVRVEVQQRVQTRVATSEQGFGESVAGFGVSAVPGRAVDLESVWLDDERLRVWHDIDRLSVSFRLPAADLTVGRQAVTWGDALLFPIADLWSRFSPFELDTEEKPGVDAVRVLAYPRSGLEVDAVAAARERSEDFSVGARATLGLPSADVWVGGGKLWNQAMAMGGVTWLRETTRLRAEVVLPYHLDADRVDDPRLTLGIDRIGGQWSVTGEYHFNGLGASDSDRYLDRLGGEAFGRGETYYLGRHYLGALTAWTADRAERIQVSGSLLLNLQDPSAALSPAVTFDLARSTSLSVGGLLTAGEQPAFPQDREPGGPAPAPLLGSEYGTYGYLGWARFSVYF